MDDTSSDTKITVDIQTSQQKQGAISDPGGKDTGSKSGAMVYGDENAPTGLATEQSLKDPFRTSQQIKGEFSLAEGPEVVKDSVQDVQQ